VAGFLISHSASVSGEVRGQEDLELQPLGLDWGDLQVPEGTVRGAGNRCH